MERKPPTLPSSNGMTSAERKAALAKYDREYSEYARRLAEDSIMAKIEAKFKAKEK